MGATQTLPFAFRFFDGSYTQVTPSADGYLGFGATGTAWGGFSTYTVPSAASPAPAFFPFSRDLYQRTGECFVTLGTAPNRRFAWEENAAYLFFDATTTVTFEVFLNEGSNTIDVIYQTLTGTGTDGSQEMIGMQNATAALSYQWSYDVAGRLTPGLRIRFTPM
jgi:hypothetical protein